MREFLTHVGYSDRVSARTRRCILFLAVVLALATPLEIPSTVGATTLTGEKLLGFEEPYVHEGRSMNHSGVDIRTDAGSAVACLRRGSVVFAGSIPAGPGQSTNAVTIEDDRGGRWSYLPLESVSVGEGLPVAEGEMLGVLSATGDKSSKAAHLHLGYRQGGEYVDPLSVLGLVLPTRPPVRSPGEEPGEVTVDDGVSAPFTQRAESTAEPSVTIQRSEVSDGEQVQLQSSSTGIQDVLEISHAPIVSMDPRAIKIRDRGSSPVSYPYAQALDSAEPETAAPIRGYAVLMLVALGGAAGTGALRARNHTLNDVCTEARSTRLQPR